ncbi:MAG: response regulator transcription factor [Deltaproteobacteria bacterium]|nr:MAG: response regulator transcription factor [Deltaproteobacteria bacterium]TMQ22290.1 MAG: response regulator transcription factor [Deltaproteobacteria bacterium]
MRRIRPPRCQAVVSPSLTCCLRDRRARPARPRRGAIARRRSRSVSLSGLCKGCRRAARGAVRWHNGSVRILVVEDEASLREGIVDLLAGDGHQVVAVGDGVAGVEAGLRDPFDLVVLDLMLPRLDGMEVCRRLRAARPGVPILMLTARGSEDDKVRGLMEGADDYVTKPFSARELLARVRALGRRAPAESLDEVQVDGAVIDLARMIVVRGDERVTLTPREVGIVRWLHRHRDRVVSRAELLEQVFGQRGDLQTRAVDMAIAVLRKKLEADPARPTVIVSVKGAGYAWRLAR